MSRCTHKVRRCSIPHSNWPGEAFVLTTSSSSLYGLGRECQRSSAWIIRDSQSMHDDAHCGDESSFIHHQSLVALSGKKSVF